MEKIDKIVIATRNPAKRKRYGALLSGLADEIFGLNDLGITDKPSETGETAEQNAEIKAKFYSQMSGLIAFSEDEALFVDFVPPEKQPGVHVRRIEGRDEANDDQLLAYWERVIARVPPDQRSGRWQIAYCLATPAGQTKTIALDYPRIFFSPSSKIRIPGWPMSSLQGPAALGKPHSELTEKEQAQLNRETDRLLLEKLRELFK